MFQQSISSLNRQYPPLPENMVKWDVQYLSDVFCYVFGWNIAVFLTGKASGNTNMKLN